MGKKKLPRIAGFGEAFYLYVSLNSTENYFTVTFEGLPLATLT